MAQPQAVAHVAHVAICISGAARSEATLRAVVDALKTHLLDPSPDVDWEFFAWLQDDASEAQLEALLPPPWLLVTRRQKLSSDFRSAAGIELSFCRRGCW